MGALFLQEFTKLTTEADPEVEFLVMPDLDGIWGNVLERGRLLRTWLFPSHFGKFSPSVLEIDA